MGVISKAAGAVGGAVAVAKAIRASITVTGAPLLARDKPASVSIGGFEFFKRDDNLERTYLGGLIKRGRSAYAKKALAGQGIQ